MLTHSQNQLLINNFWHNSTYDNMVMAEKRPTISNMHTSKELEVYLRKQKVWDLTLQGFTQEEIAKKLDVSTKTISRDAHEIKKDSVRWMDTLPRGQIQMYHRSNFETIERVTKELWQLYEAADDDKLKVKILKTITDNRKIHSNLLGRSDLMKLGDTLHEIISPATGGLELHNLYKPKRQEIDYDKL